MSTSNLSQKLEIINNNKSIYEKWKKNTLSYKVGYFIIFQTFKDNNLLAQISGSALKLYLFLGLHTNNYSGECWVTIQKAAEYFGKDPRTISIWIKELEKLGLIERVQVKPKQPSYTFLKPY